MELTYNIFPSCLDISPPQSIYARSNVTNPVRSDGTVLSVWRRLSASAARRRGEFGSFKNGVDDWFIAGCFTLTDRSYSSDGPTKEELHTTQGLNSCSWPRLNVVKSGRLTRRTLDVERNNEVAGTPAATTGLKRFCKGSRRLLMILSLNTCFLQPSLRQRLRCQAFKGYLRPI